MTIAASFRVTESETTGAPGFEPGIAGPKPAALPLGYAPPGSRVTPVDPDAREAGLDGGRPGEAGTASMVGAAESAPRHLATPHQGRGNPSRAGHLHWKSLVARGEQHDERDGRQDPDDDQGQGADHDDEDRHEGDQRL
jgi:hypothetical protein